MGDDDRLTRELKATIELAFRRGDRVVPDTVDSRPLGTDDRRGEDIRLRGTASPAPPDIQVTIDRVMPFGDDAVLVAARLVAVAPVSRHASPAGESGPKRSIFICERQGDSWQIVAVLRGEDDPLADQ